MVKIAYLLLCHKNAVSVIAQARALVAAGDAVAIHFDKRGDNAEFDQIREAFEYEPSVALVKRVACGWGEYSLVQASLNLIHAARSQFDAITHYFLMSGDCYPAKSGAFIRKELAAGDRDFVETNDFLDSDWIKTGLKEDRLIYRHFVNERERPELFYSLLNIQRRLGLKRKIPKGLRVKIGSQWWLLRAASIEKMLAYLEEHPNVVRFFKTTWIPDEIMFQTIASQCVPRDEIRSHPPTTLIFSDYGIPVVFHRDNEEMLRHENRFFARKITGNDPVFRQSLLDHYVNGDLDPPGEEMIASYYTYLARRGRDGRRHAQRFWEQSTTLDDSKEVLVIACKKWHIGQQFAEAVERITNIKSLNYVFDQDEPLDMDLGNLEVGKDKRGRHRRAFLGLLFDAQSTSKLALCVDPSRDDVVRDFADTDCRMRILLIDTPFDEDEYEAHALRIGLLGHNATPAQRDTVVSALKVEFAEESGQLRKVNVGRLDVLGAAQNRVEKAAAVARFLRVGRDEVEAIVREIEPGL
ncbi:MAG: DUF5928 domain-containing protein [Pseudomonadota bacterium]